MILKALLLGAVVAYSINYVTKKREDGTSIIDDLKAIAPELMGGPKEQTVQVVELMDKNADQSWVE